MGHHSVNDTDYGTGRKKLELYLVGFISCILLTIFSFWAVMSEKFTKFEVLIFIFGSAIAQFLVQVIFFLRLTTKSPQGKINIMAFIFTGVILTSIICGSLWIMWNLNYNMIH